MPKIEKSKVGLIFKFLSMLGLIVQFLTIIRVWGVLPDIIPVHFNILGETDAYGDKSDLFILLALSAATYLGLGWLIRHPDNLNYPWKVDKENSAYQYQLAATFLEIIRAETIWLFTYIALQTISIAAEFTQHFKVLPFVIIAIAISFTVIGYLFLASRSTNKDL